MTMARYSGVVQDQAGNIITNAKIEVRREQPGQPLAALKSDRAGATPLVNPFDAEADGSFAFHVTGGAYKIRAYVGPSGAPTFEAPPRRYVGIGLGSETDSVAGGSPFAIVRVVSTANVTIASALEAGDTLDGVTLVAGDFVLLTAQTAPEENGVYEVPSSGAASRAAVFSTYDSMPGCYFSVMDGTAGADALYRCTSNRGGTLETDAIAISEFSAGSGGREVLTANRTYYVRSASTGSQGSDSNDGLANTAGGAFLTIQKAISVVAMIDLSAYSVTIQLTGNFTETPLLKSYIGAGPVIIVGDETTPSNVTITGTGTQTGVVQADSVLGRWDIRGVKITSAVSNQMGLFSTANSIVKFQNVDFGSLAGAGYHINCADGAIVEATGNYSISGGANYHYAAIQGGLIRVAGRTVTLSGTPAFSSAFAYASSASAIRAQGMTFSGAATGVRYLSELASAIRTLGGGANYFPGNSAGTADAATYGAYN